MNVPTRTELKRALARIDALEPEVAGLKAKARAKPQPQRAAEARAPSAKARE